VQLLRRGERDKNTMYRTSRKPGGQKPFYGLGVVEKMSDIMA